MKSNLEYIEDYFADLLTESEKKIFNSRIKSDNKFADEVAFYLQAKKLGHLEKKKQFHELNKSLDKQSSLKVVKGIGSIAAAAILIIGLWILFFNNTQTPQEYAQNYIDKKLITLDTDMAVSQDSLSNAVELYNQKKYSEALGKLMSIQSPLSLEYQGLCQLQLKEYDLAVVSFESLSKIDTILQNKGLFYKAIVLIKIGKIHEGKASLELIKNKPYAFGKNESMELIKLLE